MAAGTVIFIVDCPAPVIVVPLKDTVTVAGWPLALKVTVLLNPPLTALVMVELPEPPWATESEAGFADRLKPEDDELPPASAAIRADPFGLPQPLPKSYPVVAE